MRLRRAIPCAYARDQAPIIGACEAGAIDNPPRILISAASFLRAILRRRTVAFGTVLQVENESTPVDQLLWSALQDRMG